MKLVQFFIRNQKMWNLWYFLNIKIVAKEFSYLNLLQNPWRHFMIWRTSGGKKIPPFSGSYCMMCIIVERGTGVYILRNDFWRSEGKKLKIKHQNFITSYPNIFCFPPKNLGKKIIFKRKYTPLVRNKCRRGSQD